MARAAVILLSWQRPDGTLKGFNNSLPGSVGASKTAMAIDEMQKSRWMSWSLSWNKRDLGVSLVPFEYACAQACRRAQSTSARATKSGGYSVWRSSIETRERKRDEFSPGRTITDESGDGGAGSAGRQTVSESRIFLMDV